MIKKDYKVKSEQKLFRKSFLFYATIIFLHKGKDLEKFSAKMYKYLIIKLGHCNS